MPDREWARLLHEFETLPDGTEKVQYLTRLTQMINRSGIYLPFLPSYLLRAALRSQRYLTIIERIFAIPRVGDLWRTFARDEEGEWSRQRLFLPKNVRQR